MVNLLIITLFCAIHSINGTYYIYPTASSADGKTVLLMEQSEKNMINVLLWDTVKNNIEKELWSLFKPVNVQLLSNGTGFSFIDNGRLRIKYFDKKSPKTVDFDHYLYKFNTIDWIDSNSFYCSAKTTEYYEIFYCSLNGYSNCIASSEGNNCIYPQKIDNHLFYIEQSIETDFHTINRYRIITTSWEGHANTKKYDIVIDNYDQPIAFLVMRSDKEGFFVQHSETGPNSTTFDYYMIQKSSDAWKSYALFSFTIPNRLIMDSYDECLYESLLPLLPKIIGNSLYFVSLLTNEADEGQLGSYCYDIQKKYIQRNNQISNNGFVPLLCGTTMIFGGATNAPLSLLRIPFLT